MPHAHYRLAIFDFDGTLADSAGWFLRTLNEMADRHRFRRVSDPEAEMLRGRSNREIIRYLGVPAWKLPLIANDMRAQIAADTAEIHLFPGADTLLRSLSERGMRIAIVSSNSEQNIRRILGSNNARCVHHFECGAALFGKAQKFRRVIKHCGAIATQTICIGDETRDIEAAQAVGADSAAVLWGYASADILADYRPTLTFKTIEELAAGI